MAQMEKKSLPQIPQCGRGNCKEPAALESHTCPYQEDVKDNKAFECDCCEKCTQGCTDDI